jgi:hypothetical protein
MLSGIKKKKIHDFFEEINYNPINFYFKKLKKIN